MIETIKKQAGWVKPQYLIIDWEDGKNIKEDEFTFDLRDYSVVVSVSYSAYCNTILGNHNRPDEDIVTGEDFTLNVISIFDESGTDIIEDFGEDDLKELDEIFDTKIIVE